MASLLAMGNGVYNRDGIVIDYNGRQGHHPKECNCVKHINNAAKVNPPQMITQGVIPMVNQPLTLDPAILQALATNPTALNAYIASVNNAPSIEANPNPVPPVNPNPALVNPVVPTFVAGQNEYVIPINVALPKKATSMAQITDARIHLEPQFTNGIHDFRFSKGYASTAIVGNGEWELVLRRKA